MIMEKLRSVGLSPAMLVFFAVLAIVPLFIQDEYILRLLVVSMLLGSQAMAFDFTAGLIEIINFGFAAFMGFGAYTSALLVINFKVNFVVGFLAAAISAGLLGFLIGVLTLRLRGIFAACMTWFLGLTLMTLIAINVKITRGNLGLPVPYLLDSPSSLPYYYILLPMSIFVYVALRGVAQSNIGLAFRAIGQNIDAARASGINPTRYRVLNFTLSCAIAGLMGAFYAHYMGVLTSRVLGTNHTTEVLALSFIGGRGTIWGGLVSALLIVPLFEYLKQLEAVRWIIYGLLMILVMVAYPAGIAGGVQALWGLLKRLVARRPPVEEVRPSTDTVT
jgi:branched-chain amino acid transport system permease protein